jgi:transposase-like protein
MSGVTLHQLDVVAQQLSRPKAAGSKMLPSDCILRRVKYLNNVIEQDHRFIKKKVQALPNASSGFTLLKKHSKALKR